MIDGFVAGLEGLKGPFPTKNQTDKVRPGRALLPMGGLCRPRDAGGRGVRCPGKYCFKGAPLRMLKSVGLGFRI